MFVVGYGNPAWEMQTFFATDKTIQGVKLKCHIHFNYGKRLGKSLHELGKKSPFFFVIKENGVVVVSTESSTRLSEFKFCL